MALQDHIEQLFEAGPSSRSPESLKLLAEFRAALNRGEIRAVAPEGDKWNVNSWVRKGIMLHAVLGVVSQDEKGSSFELDTMPLRRFTPQDGVRIVPGGSTIRDGIYLGSRVSCIAPLFINMGAHIGADAILDSHVSVGFCAQIGERVHIGPGTQIGGVLHPLDRLPAILGDDVVIGGNCGIYEGVCIGKRAIVGAGMILTGATRVFDLKNRCYFKRTPEQPLLIPPDAIVVPGVRPMQGAYAASGLMLPVGVLVGYRNDANLAEDVMAGLLD